MEREIGKTLSLLSPFTYITLRLAQSFLETTFSSALFYSIQVLTYSEREGRQAISLEITFQSLVNLGYLEEATLLLCHIYYVFPTLSSRETRELILPVLPQISPEKFFPSQRLSLANFLFSLGFTEKTKDFLDQIEEFLPPSQQVDIFTLRARIFVREENWEELEQLISKNLLKRGETEEVLFYWEFRTEKANYGRAAQIYEGCISLPRERICF